MRLYATIESERPSRPAKKGGNKKLVVNITDRGRTVYTLKLWVESGVLKTLLNETKEDGQVITRYKA